MKGKGKVHEEQRAERGGSDGVEKLEWGKKKKLQI